GRYLVESRHDIRVAGSSPAARSDPIRVGHLRQQPPRQVLLHHPPWLPAPRRNRGELGTSLRRDCPIFCHPKGALSMSDTIRAFFSRLFGIFTKSRQDHDFDEELSAHVDLLAAENEKSGMTPDEARRTALLRLGGRESLREMHRQERGLPFLEVL